MKNQKRRTQKCLGLRGHKSFEWEPLKIAQFNSKSSVLSKGPWVRIPPSPPVKSRLLAFLLEAFLMRWEILQDNHVDNFKKKYMIKIEYTDINNERRFNYG